MNGGSTGKREMPSRTSTSRWFSARGDDVDDDLARPGLRVGHLFELEHVQPAELVEYDRFHARPPFEEACVYV